MTNGLPVMMLTHLARVTRPGGIGVFNLLEPMFQEQGIAKVMDELESSGAWKQIYVRPPVLSFLLAEADHWLQAYVVRVL